MNLPKTFILLVTFLFLGDALTLSREVLAEGGKASDKVMPTETIGGVISGSIIPALCGEAGKLKSCYPAFENDCTATLKPFLSRCVAKETAKVPPRLTAAESEQILWRTSICVAEAVLAPPAVVKDSAECKAYAREARDRIATQKARGFVANNSATQDTGVVVRSLIKILADVRCNPEVVSACFRVPVQECNSILIELADKCAQELQSSFGATVNRDQGGELGKKLDQCVGTPFLPRVVQPHPPTAECTAAMRAHW